VTGINFTPSEESRYSRHALIEWWDQARLARARVIVVGAGALGNEVLKLLALLGVGHIQVVDFDVVSPSNLARTVLFRETDVGRLKVEAAAERVGELNPEIEVEAIPGDLRFTLGLGTLRRADIVFGCLDSVNARWALNRRCLLAGAGWIDGGISDFHGQVARYSPHGGACYECTFTEATYERFNRRYSCPYGLLSDETGQAVPTTAITTSATAALMVQEGLYALHGLAEAGLAPGERLTLYLKPYRMVRDVLPANPDCLAHESLPEEVAALPAPEGGWTAAAAIQAARRILPEAEAVELPFELVLCFTCPACGERQEVLRPKEAVRQAEAACPRCGLLRLPETTSTLDLHSPYAGLPLARLGLPAAEILAFRSAHESVYLELA
jgi:adenylyltransferase/sulfurtransferase